MIMHLANDPLPYRPIEIVDVSPYHSTFGQAPSRAGARRRWITRSVVAGLVAGIVLIGAVGVGAVGDDGPSSRPATFRSAPGHAMPPDLAR